MTAVTRNPTNLDLLQSTKFRLIFNNLPGITYFCQNINIPGVSLSEIPRHTPFIDLYVPGEKLVYDTLNITFLVDEEMRTWEQLHDWLRALTFPTDFNEYAQLPKITNRSYPKQQPQYSDASFTVHTNKNNPNIRFQFKDLFPTTLSPILLNASDTADNIITADATFRFSYYNIERI